MQGDIRQCIPKDRFWTTLKKASLKEILGQVHPLLSDKAKNFRHVKNNSLNVDLEDYERKQVRSFENHKPCIAKSFVVANHGMFCCGNQVIRNYKIGVLYCKEGQSEGEMFNNGKSLHNNNNNITINYNY